MTGWKLFKTRLLDDFRFQRKILSSVVDWIVCLYVILPTLIFATVIYVDIWRNIDTYWFDFLPLSAVINLLLLLSLQGKFRTFMLEADILFLLDRPKLYKELRGWTFFYSLLQLFFTTAMLFGIALPFLVQGYGLGLEEILLLFAFLLGYRLTVYTLKKIIHHPVLRWFVLIAIVYIISANLAVEVTLDYLAFVGLFFIIFWSILHAFKTISTKRFYFQEVANENKERVRYAKLILGMSMEVEKTPIRLGKRPLFIRKGRRIFRDLNPENGLLELLLKGFIRNSVFLTSYIQVNWVSLFAIILLPVWGKWVVFGIAILFFQYNSWLRGLFEKMLDQHFFNAVPFDERIRENVWLRFKRWLMIPAVSLLGIATITLSVMSIIGGL